MSPVGDGLSKGQIESFVARGFLRLDDAFPCALADACRAILWHAAGCAEDDPRTWTRPVVRVPHLALPPFVAAANTPRLHAAFDALVGRDRWLPLGGLGTFPIRFPSTDAPGDDGWHIDTSLGHDETPSFLDWRINLASDGRALLLLFLLSDVGEDDAPTRIRIGSHATIARALIDTGDRGRTLGELVTTGIPETAGCDEALATGPAGTVYVCHPFLVHAAQAHRGTRPRFLAQPPLLPKGRMDPRRGGEGASMVERAIAGAIAGV